MKYLKTVFFLLFIVLAGMLFVLACVDLIYQFQWTKMFNISNKPLWANNVDPYVADVMLLLATITLGVLSFEKMRKQLDEIL